MLVLLLCCIIVSQIFHDETFSHPVVGRYCDLDGQPGSHEARVATVAASPAVGHVYAGSARIRLQCGSGSGQDWGHGRLQSAAMEHLRRYLGGAGSTPSIRSWLQRIQGPCIKLTLEEPQ